MERFIHIKSTVWLKERRKLLAVIYEKDPHYRDSTTPLLKMLLSPSSSFAANTEIMPITIRGKSRQPVASALFMVARKMPDILQVGFFEARSDQQKSVTLLMSKAREIAKAKGFEKVIIGMDGHINNGLGFLAEKHESPPCFGSNYNPSYYIDYMEWEADPVATLDSYLYDLSDVNFGKWRKVIERISRRFTVREGNFKNLRQEIGIYTQLNNACFSNHPLYFERSAEEDHELFRSFGPFLKEENFLISEFNGEPIGFLLWYPDFHELVHPGRKLGLGTALKYRMPGSPISKFKIAEIGILPKYQGSAAIAGLIGRCLEICKKNGHSRCESGWIFDTNTKSKSVSERWEGQRHKSYTVFEINLGENR